MSDLFDQTKVVIDLYIKSSDTFIKLSLVVIAASVAFPTKEWPSSFAPPHTAPSIMASSDGFGWIWLFISVLGDPSA